MQQVTSALTESEIVALVRDGRREGYEAMLCRYADRVFAMIVKLVPNVMDAQELTQDIFLRAFDRINSYDPQRSSLSTWLCRIAYRMALDYLLLRWLSFNRDCLHYRHRRQSIGQSTLQNKKETLY